MRQKTIFLFCAALGVAGCASMTGSSSQPIVVRGTKAGNEVAGATCNLTNDRGNWVAFTPGSALVRKSGTDLAVTCFHTDGGVGSTVVSSSSNSGLWGNIIVGGAIGATVDASRGVGFDYPSIVTVEFSDIAPTRAAAGPQ
jgi:hypothetical protein